MNENLIKNTEGRLQFAVMLSLFFPVLMEAMFGFAGSSSIETSGNVLKSGLVIFLLIINYLLFEWRKDKLPIRFLNYFNWVIILTITYFAILIIFFALMANGNMDNLNWLNMFLYVWALFGIMVFPALSIILISLQYVYESFKN